MTPANATGAQLAKAGPRLEHTETRTASIAERSAADKTRDEKKRVSTATARLALKGHELRRMADGTFLVFKWNLSRSLVDIDAVERFAEQVGA